MLSRQFWFGYEKIKTELAIHNKLINDTDFISDWFNFYVDLAHKLYNEFRTAFDKGDYVRAVKLNEEISAAQSMADYYDYVFHCMV